MLALPTLATLLALSAPLVAAHGSPRRAHHAVQQVEKRAFSFSAPHYSLYLDDSISYSSWPSADSISPYNRVLLAFWETSGATAASQAWAGFTADQRSTIVNAYHSAGIAIMVSAFGDDDLVITNKKDPVATADSLATFVKDNNLDGVDIDLEDFAPLKTGGDQTYALDWLTKFHNELRTQLPSDTYAISSTPTAWMYGNVFGSADSVYCKLHAAVGSQISWYNFQFYNGGANTWDTCEHTMWASTDAAFLSLKEISDMCSIPMNMITVGKLWSSSDLATNVPAEVPTPADFGTCLKQAQAQINYPDTGVMVWAAHMDNWSGAITFLSDTITAMNSAVASSSAASGTANVSAATDSAAIASVASASNTAAQSGADANSTGTGAVVVAGSTVVGGSTDTAVNAAATGAAAISGTHGTSTSSKTGADASAAAASGKTNSGVAKTAPVACAVVAGIVAAAAMLQST